MYYQERAYVYEQKDKIRIKTCLMLLKKTISAKKLDSHK